MESMVAWLQEPARRLHAMIREVPGLASLHHLSLSVYCAQHDTLWAFPCNSDDKGPPEITEIRMTDVPSLVLLADETTPRIVADMAAFGGEGRYHTSKARASESRSCMTAPINIEGRFLGFVTYGAAVPNFFSSAAQDTLRTFTEAFGILIERSSQLSD
ncbi:GAF domain-containing protein [Paramagnetospirillum magnetotacticum]|nr:GAF domain-containing protein [Paramagnetospirillum magnetotacticum]